MMKKKLKLSKKGGRENENFKNKFNDILTIHLDSANQKTYTWVKN